MIKIENLFVTGWKPALRGMRNPLNSWDRADTLHISFGTCDDDEDLRLAQVCGGVAPILGKNDLDLAMRLVKGGSTHAKFRRMIVAYIDITAPLYWWKEFDTYKVGTVANSCSTMHKIAAKEFTRDDFSCEHLTTMDEIEGSDKETLIWYWVEPGKQPKLEIRPDAPIILLNESDLLSPAGIMDITIKMLNRCRELYLRTKDKRYWWQMIQLLPSSYNQKRTVELNYEVLAHIYHDRKGHKLDEWNELCGWIETLPYSQLITGGATDGE